MKCILHIDSFSKEIELPNEAVEASKYAGLRHLISPTERKAFFLTGASLESPQMTELKFDFSHIIRCGDEIEAHYFCGNT